MAKNTSKKRPKHRLHNWHKHPLVLPVGLFFVLFFFSLGMFVSSGATTIGASDVRVVTLSIDGQKQTVPTRARTVADLLERLEIELHESDVIEPSLQAELEHDFRINVYTSRTVVVIDGDERQYIDTAEPEPREVVRAADIELYDEDIVERDNSEPLDAFEVLQEGAVSERIVIARSIPVMLNLFGVDYELRTHAQTVEELLNERGIDIADASVFPEADTPLTEEEAVFVTDPDKEIVMEEEEIAPAQEFVDDYDLLIGQTDVRDEGRPGRRVVIYEIAADGSREVLQQVTVRQPKTQIVARGRQAPQVVGDRADIMRQAGISDNDLFYVDRIIQYESNWNITARNASSGAYGLCQSLPGNKMASAGSDWETNPVTQIRWCNSYAQQRYGSWSSAFDFWQRNRWW